MHDSEAFYALTMGVAEGRIDKSAVAAELEHNGALVLQDFLTKGLKKKRARRAKAQP